MDLKEAAVRTGSPVISYFILREQADWDGELTVTVV